MVQNVSAEVRAYLAKIGAKGRKHSSGTGGRAVWADVPARERSKRMRDLVRKRWAKRKRNQYRKAALWCGFTAALLMTFVSPGWVTRYTVSGEGALDLRAQPTSWGQFWGVVQGVLSVLGAALLVVSFVLELLAIRRERT